MCIDAFTSDPTRFVDTATGRRMQKQPTRKVDRKKVAILIFEGVQIIDYTGPYEVFGQAGYEVFPVAEKPELLTTTMGMQVKPSYSFANAPLADLVVLPGGSVQDENPAILDWVKKNATLAKHVLSVCNGAFYLARSGLLDGLRATTYYGLIDALQKIAPNTEVVNDARFVDNGKLVTTAGLSSGIDGALHMVSKISGFGKAQAVALNMEYDWKPDSTYARASFADAPIRWLGEAGDFGLPKEQVLSWVLSEQAGDANSWVKRWQLETDLPPAEMRKRIATAMSKRWSRNSRIVTIEPSELSWRFSERDGSEWHGLATLQSTAETGQYRLSVEIKRDIPKRVTH